MRLFGKRHSAAAAPPSPEGELLGHLRVDHFAVHAGVRVIRTAGLGIHKVVVAHRHRRRPGTFDAKVVVIRQDTFGDGNVDLTVIRPVEKRVQTDIARARRRRRVVVQSSNICSPNRMAPLSVKKSMEVKEKGSKRHGKVSREKAEGGRAF